MPTACSGWGRNSMYGNELPTIKSASQPAIASEEGRVPTTASAAVSSWRTCTKRTSSSRLRSASMKPLMPSPGRPKIVSTPQSIRRWSMRSETVSAISPPQSISSYASPHSPGQHEIEQGADPDQIDQHDERPRHVVANHLALVADVLRRRDPDARRLRGDRLSARALAGDGHVVLHIVGHRLAAPERVRRIVLGPRPRPHHDDGDQDQERRQAVQRGTDGERTRPRLHASELPA